MSNAGFNPHLVRVPPFPWTARGNSLVDANGRKIAAFFCADPTAVASRIAEMLNDHVAGQESK